MYKTREEYITNYLSSNMIGAELGVFEGTFSEILINSGKFDKLFLVDIFQGDMFSGDKNGEHGKTINLDDSFHQLSGKYSSNEKVEVVKNTTSNFLNSLADNTLDFVYIDADHSFDAVLSDLELSKEKVKIGGIIAGHDYNPARFKGVVDAVDIFLAKYGLRALFTETDKLASYFIVNR